MNEIMPDFNKPIKVGDMSFVYKNVYHPIVWLGEEPYRPRVELLAIKDRRYVFLRRYDKNDSDENYKYNYRIPGGSVDADSTKEEQAKAETNEEGLIEVKDVKFSGVSYYELYKPGFLLKGGDMPIEYRGTINDVFVANYVGPYDKKYVEEKDLDNDMAKNGKFHSIVTVAKDLKPEHIRALLYSGMIDDDLVQFLRRVTNDKDDPDVNKSNPRLDPFTDNMGNNTGGVHVTESDIITPGGKLYHASTVKIDEFEARSLDLGNIDQKPGWTTFFFVDRTLALRFGLMRLIQDVTWELSHTRTKPDWINLKCRWSTIDKKPYVDASKFNPNLFLDKVFYIHTVNPDGLDVSVGNDDKLPEYSIRESGYKPECVEEILVDVSLIRDNLIITNEFDKFDKESNAALDDYTRGYYSVMLNRDYNQDPVVEKLKDAIDAGELNPGDDIEEYMEANNLSFDESSFISKLNAMNNVSVTEATSKGLYKTVKRTISNTRALQKVMNKTFAKVYSDKEFRKRFLTGLKVDNKAMFIEGGNIVKTGDTEALKRKLLTLIDRLNTVEELEYLQVESKYAPTQLNGWKKAIRDGKLDTPLTEESIDEYMRWLRNVYSKALSDKIRELKKKEKVYEGIEYIDDVSPVVEFILTKDYLDYRAYEAGALLGDYIMEESATVDIPEDIIQLNSDLNDYQYGVLLKNKRIVTDLSSINFGKEYRTLTISEFEKYKVGVCWDFANYEYYWFRKHGYQCKAYFCQLDNGKDCPTHTFIVFKLKRDPNYYHFESSWGSQQGIHSYKSMDDLYKSINKKMIDEYGKAPFCIYEYEAGPKYEHLSPIDYMTSIGNNGKIVYRGTSVGHQLESVMVETALTSKERKNLDDSDYGLPELKKYPMPDEKHVRAAVRFFNYVDPENEVELARNINKKIKKFGMKDQIKVSSKNRFSEYYGGPVTESDLVIPDVIARAIDTMDSDEFIQITNTITDDLHSMIYYDIEEVSGKPAGTIMIFKDSNNVGHIVSTINRQMTGFGVTNRLVDRMLTSWTNLGVTSLRWSVGTDVDNIMSMLDSYGFKQIESDDPELFEYELVDQTINSNAIKVEESTIMECNRSTLFAKYYVSPYPICNSNCFRDSLDEAIADVIPRDNGIYYVYGKLSDTIVIPIGRILLNSDNWKMNGWYDCFKLPSDDISELISTMKCSVDETTAIELTKHVLAGNHDYGTITVDELYNQYMNISTPDPIQYVSEAPGDNDMTPTDYTQNQTTANTDAVDDTGDISPTDYGSQDNTDNEPLSSNTDTSEDENDQGSEEDDMTDNDYGDTGDDDTMMPDNQDDSGTDIGDESSHVDSPRSNILVKNYSLIRDFESMYSLIDDINNTIDSTLKPNSQQNQVLVQVSRNLTDIKDFIKNFIQFQFKDGDYEYNLYYYMVVVQFLKINLEMVEKVSLLSGEK